MDTTPPLVSAWSIPQDEWMSDDDADRLIIFLSSRARSRLQSAEAGVKVAQRALADAEKWLADERERCQQFLEGK